MDPLELVKLKELKALSSGRPEIIIGLIDGPVATHHPDLANENIRATSAFHSACTQANSFACFHGTFVAGILFAKRYTAAPAICPNCTLLVRPIFAESASVNREIPSTTPQELATTLIECIDAGARLINLSASLAQPSPNGERTLEDALGYAAMRGVIVVAAAGNQGTLGSSAITRHPWVIPVAACDLSGRPINDTNLGNSIGKQGLSAPGEGITSLSTDGKTLTQGGTSVATPFVTGAIALLWSLFPTATAGEIRMAITHGNSPRRNSVVPPLMDAWAAYQAVARNHARQ
ncbi:MAG: S8 family serine peptidase [Gammaproteobacteria bacterium]